MDNVTLIRVISGVIAVGVFLLPLYFLPLILARNKRHFVPIIIVNVLLGWTVLGWIGVLIWALVDEPKQPSTAAPSSVVCLACGKPVVVGVPFCSNCGGAISNPNPSVIPASSYQPGIQQTSGKAIGSLICGLIPIFPVSVGAIILGHISLSEIRKSAGRLSGQGLAIAGLVLGYMGVAVIPVLIIAAIAIPNLLRARIAANESAAVGSMRTLITAEFSYSQSRSHSGFTCNLSELASAGLIDNALGSGKKYGYRFDLQNCVGKTEGGPPSKIQITASPVQYNTTGIRAFCADEGGIVRMDPGGSAENCVAGGSTLE